ncbi:hypothetical protein AAMO2058_000231300 [Amorphochlora amoebiformis]
MARRLRSKLLVSAALSTILFCMGRINSRLQPKWPSLRDGIISRKDGSQRPQGLQGGANYMGRGLGDAQIGGGVRSAGSSPDPVSFDWSAVSDEDASTSGDLEQAHRLRINGNKLFREGKIQEAIRCFGLALTVAESPVVLSNRAACFLRQGHYVQALEDATRAVALQPTNVKALYRRGVAQMRLERWEEAMQDFERARLYAGGAGDRELSTRLGECQAVLDMMANNSFDNTVQQTLQQEANDEDYSYRNENDMGDADEQDTPRVSPQPEGPTTDYKNFNWRGLVVEDEYTGPRIGPQGITLEFIIKMIHHFKSRRQLHRKYVWYILSEVLDIFYSLPSLVHVPLPKSAKKLGSGGFLSVCGDTHGQFFDLIHIFEINGLPSPDNPYLFNGDFVDRGPFSFETVTTLLAFKVLYPRHVHLLRGNHESRLMNGVYGFMQEVKDKYTMMEYDMFEEVFDALPLAAVLENKVLVVHGGLFKRKNVTLDEIKSINRFGDIPPAGIMCEMLWSDPKMGIGIGRSPRGVACSFGPDVTARFLKRNGLDLLVRSHEVRDQGYSWEHNRKLITVFSAPNYCGQMRNQGALLRFRGEKPTEPDILQFNAVESPKVDPYFDIQRISQLHEQQQIRNQQLDAMEKDQGMET